MVNFYDFVIPNESFHITCSYFILCYERNIKTLIIAVFILCVFVLQIVCCVQVHVSVLLPNWICGSLCAENCGFYVMCHFEYVLCLVHMSMNV